MMSFFFEMPDLNKLRPGMLSLGAPVSDEAVIINTRIIDLVARLKVIIDPPQITIAREDGAALQIAELTYSDHGAEKQKSVLDKPVGELVLKDTKKDGIWFVDKQKDLVVNDRNALRFFIS